MNVLLILLVSVALIGDRAYGFCTSSIPSAGCSAEKRTTLTNLCARQVDDDTH